MLSQINQVWIISTCTNHAANTWNVIDQNFVSKLCTDCVAKAPTNGSVTKEAVPHGTSTTFSCDDGYTLSGDGQRTCTSGSLTPPTCTPGSKLYYVLRQPIKLLHFHDLIRIRLF